MEGILWAGQARKQSVWLAFIPSARTGHGTPKDVEAGKWVGWAAVALWQTALYYREGGTNHGGLSSGTKVVYSKRIVSRHGPEHGSVRNIILSPNQTLVGVIRRNISELSLRDKWLLRKDQVFTSVVPDILLDLLILKWLINLNAMWWIQEIKRTAHQIYHLVINTLTVRECVPILQISEIFKVPCYGRDECNKLRIDLHNIFKALLNFNVSIWNCIWLQVTKKQPNGLTQIRDFFP